MEYCQDSGLLDSEQQNFLKYFWIISHNDSHVWFSWQQMIQNDLSSSSNAM